MPFILMTWIFVLGVIVTEENINKSLVVFKALIQVGLYVKRLRERRGGMNSVFIICIFNGKRNTGLAPFTAATVIINMRFLKTSLLTNSVSLESGKEVRLIN